MRTPLTPPEKCSALRPRLLNTKQRYLGEKYRSGQELRSTISLSCLYKVHVSNTFYLDIIRQLKINFAYEKVFVESFSINRYNGKLSLG